MIHPELDFRLNLDNLIELGSYRITLLTRHAFRVEYDPQGRFTDEPSLNVIKRYTDRVSFSRTQRSTALIVENDVFVISFNPHEEPKKNFRVTVKGYAKPYVHGLKAHRNLKGTARTLDQINGRLQLNDGYFSLDGYAILDDSTTPLFQRDGSVKARKPAHTDFIFIAGRDEYKEVHSELVKFLGSVPKFPRYVLGNWWSKYWNYTDRDLLGVVDRFKALNIPLSVCIVDMDWHLTDLPGKDYWYGWTGYTVNPTYFPDFNGFINQLHARHIRTSVNLHPALGIRPHEAQYAEFCAWMNLDPSEGKTIPFAIDDPHFREGYFKILHHPYEAQGVDFWWIDWQQGTTSNTEGVDPLWALNHYHALDIARDGKRRPFTFSRWTQNGGHRTPIGFSGDTVSTWESLAFQPYFTATAANVNFSWWSHDIGGHYKGDEEPELLTRWVQFGVFSPILRLHSTKNEMAIREPWLVGQPHQQVIAEAMRLRARLIPYLYTGLHLNSVKGTPFLTPLYYEYPKDPQAYKAPNTYLLGPRMVVSPVITPMIEGLNRAKTSLYLPQGQWIDFFTDIETKGGRWIDVYSPIEHLPVFVRKGSILPLAVWEDQDDPSDNPNTVWIKVYPDVSASYTLIEDDNTTQDYLKKEIFVTEFALQDKTFTIKTDKKEKAYLPLLRNYRIEVVGYHVKGNFTATLSATGSVIELNGIDLTANTTLKFSEMIRLDPKILLREQLKIALANVKANVSVKSDFLSAFDADTLEVALQKYKKEKEICALVRALTDTQTG